jgi:hypothetical protein
MTHGVPHFLWRDGRPRWEPSPTLRKLGWKGRDLKDGKGSYLSLQHALDEAHMINLKAGVTQKKLRAPRDQLSLPDGDRPGTPNDTPGYIYFLKSGDQYKIGFSRAPIRRLEQLITGLPYGVTAITALRGTMGEEQLLHRKFASLRVSGEWFEAKWKLRLFISHCAAAGKIRWDKLDRTAE